MTTFDDRENAFETHFAFEEELEFKARARGEKVGGGGGGVVGGVKDEALEDYVLSVMRADLQDPEGDEVYQKVLVDLAHKDVHVSPQEVRAHVEQLMAKARSEVGADLNTDRV